MADRGTAEREIPLEAEGLEDDLLAWLTEWTAADIEAEAELRAAYIRQARIKREKAAIRKRMATGGRKRKYPQRTNDEHHQRIVDDYLGTKEVKIGGVVIKAEVPAWQSLKHFYRRFRMGPILFCRLLDEIQDDETGHADFRSVLDALGVKGPSALQKLTAVLRILAYGLPFDAVHEYTGVQELVARKSTYAFSDWLIAKYKHIHLGVWTLPAIEKEMAINAKRGFTGMLGSLDCTHSIWKNCPYPWQGQFQDRHGQRSVIAEAIAGSDLYFWHVFLGVPGAANDLHVLGVSTLFTKYLNSLARTQTFQIGGHDHAGCFFLADGIYPDYACLMKTYSPPTTPEERNFAKQQEGVRKDVERAFGRLMIKWCITTVAAKTWFLETLKEVWMTCFLLHNMTIRDNDTTEWNEEKEEQRHTQLLAKEVRMASRGRGGARRPEFNPEELLDALDTRNAANPDQPLPMGIPEDDWQTVLDRLGHMQSHFTNYRLKEHTKDVLWELHVARGRA